MNEISAAVHFGTDGIRGIAGEPPLDPATLQIIGCAIGHWLRNRMEETGITQQVLIGRDTRASSPFIGTSLATGLSAEKIDVLGIGQVTTPELAFLVLSALDQPIGIMITASHNPYQQNGIKIFGSDGFKLPDADEAAIESLIAEKTSCVAVQSPAITMPFRIDPSPDASRAIHMQFAHALLRDLPNDLRGLSIVLDCANGAGSGIAETVFGLAGAQVTAINNQPDGMNINREAGSEHVRRDRSTLVRAVQDVKADLGIALDGDADRVVFVTPSGALLDGDHAIGLLAVALKQANRLLENTVVVTDMSNSGLVDYLATHGITTIRTKVGDRYVMDQMRAGGFVLGGEQAGHIILLDAEGRTAGDGIYAGLRLAALVAAAKHADPNNTDLLDRLSAPILRYPQVIGSATMPHPVDLDTLAGLENMRANVLIVLGGTGRINIRFSGTEPNLLRVMIEGGPSATLQDAAAQARTICNFVGAAAGDPNPPVDLVDCMTGTPL